MNDTITSQRITIEMAGSSALYLRHNLEALLALVEATPELAPTHWSRTERNAAPYARGAPAVVGRVGRRPMPQTSAYLWRRRTPKHAAALALSQKARLAFELDAKTAPTRWASLFAAADALAATFRPDWWAANIGFSLRPTSKLAEPWQSDDERDAELMFRSAFLAAKDYSRDGPRGLVMRTYVGPHFAEQWGRERIESLPLPVERLVWGGDRIDLAPEPWSSRVQSLLSAWRKGMAHLAEARLFAEPTIENGRVVGWRKGERSRLPA